MIYNFDYEGWAECSYDDETSTLCINGAICVSGVPRDEINEAVVRLITISNSYGFIAGDYEQVMKAYYESAY